MSRYFFHIRDGLIFVPDEEGIDCRSMQAMEDEARASARDVANAALSSKTGWAAPSIEVEDELGNDISPASIRWTH